MAPQPSSDRWRNRIVGHGALRAADFLANPMNWRIHPSGQQSALKGALDELGWIDEVTVNRRTNFIVDGHLRVTLALHEGDDVPVPVRFVDLSPDEEQIALVSKDPMTALAIADKDKLDALLPQTKPADAALQQFLSELAAKEGLATHGIRQHDETGLEPLSDPGPSPPARPTLADRFGVPPFSVLDARQGYWQARKRQWLALGITSELGRGENLLRFSDVCNNGGYLALAEASGLTPLMGGRPDNPQGTIPGYDMMRARGMTHEDIVLSAGANALNGTSIFDPVVCELVYRWWCPAGGRVLDPFAGGSVRGVVAAVLGRSYVGVDLRAEQVEANEAQAARLVPGAPVRWVEGDSARIESLTEGPFDLLFTCPPYYDLEHYSDDPRDLSNLPTYDAFRNAYRAILSQASAQVADDRFACLVVGDVRDAAGYYRNLVADTVAILQESGLRLYNEAILITPVASLAIRVGVQFGRYRKLGKSHQNVLTFFKGNPRHIPDVFGEIEATQVLADPEEPPALSGEL